ncbi:unnamed protein product [Allacma fusca]|uniref:G-protein coupled receptors family 3 profile domain-containing protein n=1 Tax=Allacma fusca TaxID=39272 RepID=A0A8J2LBE2_9HEXA|nr:unnamed protein product [Allacma fusca]
MYPSPSLITCTLRVWLREIGFSLAYGALMLKTWRISVIFRVRSAKAVKITDLDLMKRLGIIVAMFTALLVIRTLVAPPVAIVSLTADDLKAWLCQTDWWDHSFTFMELIFLVWGIRLCIVVRKAPSEFNESKFISLAIYNEFLLSVFLNISMLFLQSPANPDLLYIIFFCHVQLTMTLLLCLIFGSKAYMVFRGHGKGNSSDETRVPTFISKNRSGQKPKQPSGQNSTTGLHSSTTSTSHDPNFNSRLSEDVQPVCLCEPWWILKEEEFRRLYYQLEELKERNMRLGNRHLVAKITAMQEAADSILSGPTPNCHHMHQTAQQLLGQGRDSKGNEESGAESEGTAMTSNVLSDITEEDNSVCACSKPVGKKKRQSFFNRVKSTKRLLSIRSKSAKECRKASNKNAQISGEKSEDGNVSTKEEVEEGDPDERTLMAHGGVYIGEVRPNTSSPGKGSCSSPGGGSSEDGMSVSPGPSKSQGQSVDQGGGGGLCQDGLVSQVLTEVELHRRETESEKCDLPVMKLKWNLEDGAGNKTLDGDCDLTEDRKDLCSSETPESIPMTVLLPSVSKDPPKSPDKNHSSDSSKILLDLNDKSRFTEEITV